ncbi:Uncharacterised protein [uncultured archaeon]|nr:Uncharacterised protein [uncultured archaeon]
MPYIVETDAQKLKEAVHKYLEPQERSETGGRANYLLLKKLEQ